jgi:hypothetical protein
MARSDGQQDGLERAQKSRASRTAFSVGVSKGPV